MAIEMQPRPAAQHSARERLAVYVKQAEHRLLEVLARGQGQQTFGADATAALVALAVQTGRLLCRGDLRLSASQFSALLEFVACDPAYLPSASFPITKWQMQAVWYKANWESPL